jgi:cytochrome bd ubiquinol oxidase subunit II
MALEYGTFHLVCWASLGALLIGFAIVQGRDLGAAMLLPFVARNDGERGKLINVLKRKRVGTGVSALFAAAAVLAVWPPLFGVAFDCFPLVPIFFVVTLVLRPIGFGLRNKIDDPRLRSLWDWGLFLAGLVPALVFGIAVGNVLQGVPFTDVFFSGTACRGGFDVLLNPFALVTGLVSVVMLAMHGAIYLMPRTEGDLTERTSRALAIAAVALPVSFAFSGLWAGFGIDGYAVADGASLGERYPALRGHVTVVPGAWFHNYVTRPWALLGSALGLISPVLVLGLLHLDLEKAAFVASVLAVAGIVAAPWLAMFPFVLPSSRRIGDSITVWDSSTQLQTPAAVLFAMAVLVPVAVAINRTLRARRAKVTQAEVEKGESSQ